MVFADLRSFSHEPNLGNSEQTWTDDGTDLIRALVMFLAFSSWDWKAGLLKDASIFQGALAQCVRDDGLTETEDDLSEHNWAKWISIEGKRRARSIAMAYLNLQSVTYNTPPMLLNNEIHLRLPCSASKWDAKDANRWREEKSRSTYSVFFQDALHTVISRSGDSGLQQDLSVLSPLAQFILLQGIIQRIFLVRQLQMDASADLQDDDLDNLE